MNVDWWQLKASGRRSFQYLCYSQDCALTHRAHMVFLGSVVVTLPVWALLPWVLWLPWWGPLCFHPSHLIKFFSQPLEFLKLLVLLLPNDIISWYSYIYHYSQSFCSISRLGGAAVLIFLQCYLAYTLYGLLKKDIWLVLLASIFLVYLFRWLVKAMSLCFRHG